MMYVKPKVEFVSHRGLLDQGFGIGPLSRQVGRQVLETGYTVSDSCIDGFV